MRTLATVHLYCYFRTHNRTVGTARAFGIILKQSGEVATGICLIGLVNGILGAERDTDLASLAKLLVNCDIALSHDFYPQVYYLRIYYLSNDYYYIK